MRAVNIGKSWESYGFLWFESLFSCIQQNQRLWPVAALAKKTQVTIVHQLVAGVVTPWPPLLVGL